MFIWFLVFSTPQCPPAECPLHVTPQPTGQAQETITVLHKNIIVNNIQSFETLKYFKFSNTQF